MVEVFLWELISCSNQLYEVGQYFYHPSFGNYIKLVHASLKNLKLLDIWKHSVIGDNAHAAITPNTKLHW